VTGLASDVFVAEEISALHEALEQLKRIDARLHDVVEMRYFGGLTLEDIAEVRGVSSMTVKRDWQKARAYLFEVLGSSRSQL
jgi:RNA polymerase sigma factor (sigma-70 family)